MTQQKRKWPIEDNGDGKHCKQSENNNRKKKEKPGKQLKPVTNQQPFKRRQHDNIEIITKIKKIFQLLKHLSKP